MIARVFTLVELMIVVAIISILAAIAVPNFYEMQLKAKAAEGPLNADGLRTAVDSYHHAYDAWPAMTVNSHPIAYGAEGKTKHSWYPMPADWQQLSWAPDGDASRLRRPSRQPDWSREVGPKSCLSRSFWICTKPSEAGLAKSASVEAKDFSVLDLQPSGGDPTDQIQAEEGGIGRASDA